MPDRGDHGGPRTDRFAVLASAMRLASGEEAAATAGATHGVGFAELVDLLCRPFGADGAAVVRAPVAGGAPSVEVTGIGPGHGDAMVTRSLTVRPDGSTPRVIRVPPHRTPSGMDGPVADLPRDGARWLLATAPDDYDPADVEATDTFVILDPLRSWRRHPIHLRSERHVRNVLRAWEVFSCDGDPLGLTLRAGDGFAGICLDGDVRFEPTLAGAAWQIAVNP